MKHLIFIVMLVFFVSCKLLTNTEKSEPDFESAGEQEMYWAKKLFKEKYKKFEYPQFKGKIAVNDSEFQFGEIQQVQYNTSDPKYNRIFEKGLLYPEILGVDTMKICCVKEIAFLSDNPQIKRFEFSMAKNLLNIKIVHSDIYFFELTNETAREETDWETFIENAELTFIKYGWMRR